MDLHRTSGSPDWDPIAVDHRSGVQRLAASTHGIVTPPNIITIIGLGVVLYGLVALLQQQFWIGLIALAGGRLLDVVDGIVAQKTGTKSPLGEFLDATVDKIGTLLTIVVFYFAGTTYWWLITLLLIPQVMIALLTLYKRRHHIQVHPTYQGKFSMATLWVSLVGFIVAKAVNVSPMHPLSIFVVILSFLSVGLALYAFWQYATGRKQA